jgi:hypothetical protein
MSAAQIVVVLLLLVVLAVIVRYALQWRPRATTAPAAPYRRDLGCLRPDEPAPFGAASYVTEASAWLADQLLLLEPGTQWGGTFAGKPGYHNTRNGNSPSNYSVVDRPPDDGGPGDKAAGYDWTFPEAQSGDYTRIARYTSRLLASAQDPADPRLDGWREFYGQADYDSDVEGYDCRYGYACTSDASHLWHLHFSESRDQTESYDNKKALLSVLKGETVAQWRGITEGDGAVLLNCPYDDKRQDLLYVGPDFKVLHRWWTGGVQAAWSQAGKSESIGGAIVPGTLTACWLPDQSGITLCGLGAPDEPGVPAGCGQYWSYVIGRNGVKSGWGSMVGVYGAYPPEYDTSLLL